VWAVRAWIPPGVSGRPADGRARQRLARQRVRRMGCRLSCRVVGGSSAVREIAWRETSRSRDCDGWRWRCAMRFRGNVSAGHDAPSTATVRHMQRRSGGRPLVQTAKQTAGRPHELASTSPVSRFASHPRAATAYESLGHAVVIDRVGTVRRMDTSRRERQARWRASSPKARPPAGSPDGLSQPSPGARRFVSCA
jgi:hypothetical protein